jgi:hypothetical protein
MTTDTIKDVLGRIISINKNLTEESLRNLLVASGWENADIEEGVKVFHDYVGDTKLPPSGEEVRVADLKIPTQESSVEITPNVSASGISMNTVERPISETVTVEEKSVTTETSVPVYTPAPAPFFQTEEHHETSASAGEARPWALIVIDSVLFLVALGLLIYILTN